MRFKSVFVKKSSDLNRTYFCIFQFVLCCKTSYSQGSETLINCCLLSFCKWK